jgi:hypothetical protein
MEDNPFYRDAHDWLARTPNAALWIALTIVIVLAFGLLFGGSQAGLGNEATLAQRLFGAYSNLGRLRNWLCGPCDRYRGKYQLANTCQIPWFNNLGDIYTFVFGYKTDGLFVEV